MGKLLDRLLAGSPDPRRNSTLGRLSREGGVPTSNELRRVQALPCKNAVCGSHTAPYAKSLWPWQALALSELASARGLIGAGGVGAGKTRVALLAGAVLGCARPLILVPASLVQDMKDAARRWRDAGDVFPAPTIASYDDLSNARRWTRLLAANPDVIVLDEAHRVANASAARTRRLDKYLSEHPDTAVVALSGSFLRGNVALLSPIAAWVLGDGSPLPRDMQTCTDWDLAIAGEMDPGALTTLGCGGETAAEMVGARLRATAGVVFSDATEPIELPPLCVDRHLVALPPDVEDEIATVRDDDTIEPSIQALRVRTLTLGFVYEPVEPAPSEWDAARRLWAQLANDLIRRGVVDAESEARAVCADHPILLEWDALRPTHRPRLAPRWVSDAAVRAAVSWLVNGGGIVWASYTAFGGAVAAAASCPYIATGALMKSLKPGQPFVASTAALSEGQNMQAWSRMLVTTPSSSGLRWEQSLGRCHRPGQTSTVQADVWIASRAASRAFDAALAEERQTAALSGHGARKLLIASLDAQSGGEYRTLRGEKGSPAWKR